MAVVSKTDISRKYQNISNNKPEHEESHHWRFRHKSARSVINWQLHENIFNLTEVNVINEDAGQTVLFFFSFSFDFFLSIKDKDKEALFNVAF